MPLLCDCLQIHANLRHKEAQQRTYRGSSPFVAKRAEFVDWVHEVADKFRLRYTSSASAITFLDQIMDYYANTIDFYGESQPGAVEKTTSKHRSHGVASH